ncbi:MAG: hypothetical protein HOQ09_12455, partial [Gemmatimonadaceae bacterium]|nr:hypothetical protein [Gemmatimonadaceae bacterium]
RKASSSADARQVRDTLQRLVPALSVAIVALRPGALHDAQGPSTAPLAELVGRSVHAIAAIGDPDSFLLQLETSGAARVTSSIFPDHHDFSDGDAQRLALEAATADIVVCTLKDAVKLAPHWPAGAPRLWYVSQHASVEEGNDLLEDVLDALLAARSTY